MNTRSLVLAAAAILLLAPAHMVVAASLAPPEPPYEVLLVSRDIVVQARVLGLAGTSTRRFKASPGEVSKQPAFEESYETYQLSTQRLLKGKLPSSFELRVIRGHENALLLDKAKGQELLLVLAPDSGRDEAGRPRRTYLVVHGAASLLREGKFAPPRAEGAESWNLQRVAEVLALADRERAYRRATAPETARAATMPAIVGDLDRRRPAPEPPAAPQLRKGYAPKEGLDALPKPQESPAAAPR